MDPLTFSEDVERRKRSMLPMAMSSLVSPGGTLSNSVQPGQALPLTTRQRLGKLYQEMDDMDTKDVDMSGLQAFARQQGQAGEQAMLNALAAQYAGDSFQPVQAQFLRRAAAAAEPMKMGAGVLTPDGQFIKDPIAAREARRAAVERQALGLERQIEAQTRDERDRQDRLQRQQEMSQLGWFNAQTARMGANNASNSANKAPAGYEWKTAPDGSPTLAFIPGGPADPKVVTAKAGETEDMRKSAGYAFRLDSALRTIMNITGDNPASEKPGLVPALASKVPLVGDTAANVLTASDRQRVEAAQLDALDAALTLATGAAYTREQLQGLSKSYFPQYGDSPQTIVEKRARMADIIQTAKIRAGKSLPQNMQAGAPGAAAASPDDPLGLRR
jgi:hypothetical protein